jgi:hypothetical protein
MAQHISAAEGKRYALVAAGQALHRLELTDIAGDRQQGERVGVDPGERRHLVVLHPTIALTLVQGVARDEDFLRGGRSDGLEATAYSPGCDGKACLLRSADMACYDEVGGLALRQARRHRAGLLRRHRLLNVKVDLIAAGLASAMESGAK